MKKLSIILSIAIISLLSIWYYQTNKITISVIVPVYNSEKYINRCLDSILKQKGNFEIVIVDDGSTDSTPQILKEYQKNNSNIKLITQKNEGVSSARNKGLKASTSKYITFVDSDDWLEPNAFKDSIKLIKKDSPDILLTGFYDVYDKEWVKNVRGEEDAKFAPDIKKYPTRSLDKLQMFSPFNAKDTYSDLYYSGTDIRGKFFLKSFIDKHNLSFTEGINCAEDIIFIFQAFLNNPLISVTTSPIYNYYNRIDSVSKSENIINWAQKSTQKMKEKQEYKSANRKTQMLIDDSFLFLTTLGITNILRHKPNLREVKAPIMEAYNSFSKYNSTEKKSLRNLKKLHHLLFGNNANQPL